MPETTDNYHRIPVRPMSDFKKDTIVTITLSSNQGIKALMGKLKSDPGGSLVPRTYMFDIKKWSMDEAKTWVKKNKKENLEEQMTSMGLKLDDLLFSKEMVIELDPESVSVKKIEVDVDGILERGYIEASGTATSTKISNGHRFPHKVLDRAKKSMHKQPILNWHSMFPYQIDNRDILGEIDETDYTEKVEQKEYVIGPKGETESRDDVIGLMTFKGRIWDEQIMKTVENASQKLLQKLFKWSVGWRHDYKIVKIPSGEFDKDGKEIMKEIEESTKVEFDHLGLLSRPADVEADTISLKAELVGDGPSETLKDGSQPVDPDELAKEAKRMEDAEKIKDLEDKIVSLKEQVETVKSELENKTTEFDESQTSLTEVKAEFDTYKKAIHDEGVKTTVESLVATGKISPAQKDASLELALDLTPEQFKKWKAVNETAPATVPIGEESGKVETPKEKKDRKDEEDKKSQANLFGEDTVEDVVKQMLSIPEKTE